MAKRRQRRPSDSAIAKAWRKRARQLRRDARGRWIERVTRPARRRAR